MKILAKNDGWKAWVGWGFFILGAMMYIIQQVWGIFRFPTSWDKYLFLLVVFGVLSAGLTSIIGAAKGPLVWIKDWALCMVSLFGVFLIFNSVGLMYDAAVGTTTYQGNYFYLLESSASAITTASGIVNIVMSCVPVAIVVFVVLMILVGDGPDDYATSVIEGALCIGFIILASYLLHLTTGLNIFKPI